jgi:membrane-associated protease RseP (regulator of RpoE activity)
MRKFLLATLVLLALGLAVPAVVLGSSASHLPALGQNATSPPAQAAPATEATWDPWLGLILLKMNHGLAQRLGVERETGALVLHVIADSPAQKAGVQRGDIITAVGAAAVENPRDLTKVVRESGLGKTLSLTVVRSGKEQQITITAVANPLQSLLQPDRPPFWSVLAALAPQVQRAQVTVLDSDGKQVNLTLIAGTVKAAVANNILAVTPKDGGAELSLALTANVVIFGRGQRLAAGDLKAGDEVIVLQKEGTLTAVVVKPLRGSSGGEGIRQAGPPGRGHWARSGTAVGALSHGEKGHGGPNLKGKGQGEEGNHSLREASRFRQPEQLPALAPFQAGGAASAGSELVI